MSLKIRIPEKLFEKKIKDARIGDNNFHLYPKEYIMDAQVGYKIDSNNLEIKRWTKRFGNDALVIGQSSFLYDPLITNAADKNLPVFLLIQESWDVLCIAESLEQFSLILDCIRGKDFKDKNTCDKTIKEISKITKDNEILGYWRNEIVICNRKENM